MSQGLASTRMASGALAPEWVDDLGRPPGGVISIDEFDGGSLDAAWTTLTLTGSQVITVDNSLFSVRPTGLINVQDANSILQAHTLAIGDAVEIAVVGVFNDDVRSFNFGPVVSDGVVAASNCMTAFIQWTQSGFVWTYTTSGTATLTNIGVTGGVGKNQLGGTLYVRLEHDATNSFIFWISADGVTWHNVSTTARTLTPTQVGFFWNTGSLANIIESVAIDYVRIVTV